MHDPLLKELLSGDELEAVRDRTLQQLLELAGRRRRRRSRVHAALLVGVPPLILAALLALTRDWQSGDGGLAANGGRSAPTESVGAGLGQIAERRTPIVYLSDDDLLQLFPDRAAALVGRSGSQTFLFLEQQPWR